MSQSLSLSPFAVILVLLPLNTSASCLQQWDTNSAGRLSPRGTGFMPAVEKKKMCECDVGCWRSRDGPGGPLSYVGARSPPCPRRLTTLPPSGTAARALLAPIHFLLDLFRAVVIRILDLLRDPM